MMRRIAGGPVEQVERTIHEALAGAPGGTATVTPGGELSWDELAERAASLAQGLVHLGVQPGDRVALMMSNRPEFVIGVGAIAAAGAILLPLNTRLSAAELQKVIAHSDASVVIAERSFRGIPFFETLRSLQPRLPALRHLIPMEQMSELEQRAAPLPSVHPGDPAVLLYTSGTTGDPKGCLHAHRTFVTNAKVNAEHKRITSRDRVISSVPFFNVFGLLNCILEACVTGATIVIQPTFDTADAIALIERERVTVFLGTPTMWIRMEEHPAFTPKAVSTLRAGSIGGSPVPADLLARWRARDCEIAVIYGMSEAPTILLDGKPTPGLEIEIGDEGELSTRGYNHLLGYFRDEAATGERIQGGWLRTGDVAEIDSDGLVQVVGRADDMMIVGGFNVQPAEVEQVLRAHPSVTDAAVFGVPERELGEVVAAWLVLRQEASLDEDELRGFCRERLAGYKVPQHLRIVDEFPLTANGKVQRYRMRDSTLAELR